MGCSDHIFYYLLEYMQYGSREYGVLAFNADDFTYQILYDVVSPVEENAGGTLTITDDDGTVRVYDTLTGEQISGPRRRPNKKPASRTIDGKGTIWN